MSKIQSSSNQEVFIDRFFLSYSDEELWLNKMAESGLYLIKKTFYRYYFKKEQGLDIKYTVELFEYPANSPLSADYIEAKRKKGLDLVAFYKCRAYFQMNKQAYEAEKEISKKTRVKSVTAMFAVYLLAFISSLLMFCYNCACSLRFTVDASKETMSALKEEFSFFGIFEKLARLIKLDSILGDYQSTPMALMFFLAAAVFSIPVAVYFRELFLSKSKKIKKK